MSEQSMVYRTVILHHDIPEKRPVSLFRQSFDLTEEDPLFYIWVLMQTWYVAVLFMLLTMADHLLKITATYQNEWDIHQLVEQGHTDKLYRQGILIMYIQYGE